MDNKWSDSSVFVDIGLLLAGSDLSGSPPILLLLMIFGRNPLFLAAGT